MHLLTSQNLSLAGLIAAAYSSFVAAACPQVPTSFEKAECVKPKNWNDLKKIIEKRKRVVLCPFTISLKQDDPPLKLRKKHEIVCASMDKCVIEGGRTHAKISSSGADVSTYGLVFKDATKSSIVVSGSAGKNEHSICHTTFYSNEGAKGAAIKSSGRTKLAVSNSFFVRNKAGRGTIKSTGIISVSDSVFYDNTAMSDGAAIYSSDKATVTKTVFKNNKGGGSFLSGAYEFNNGGGNTGSGNTGKCGASGAFLRETKACVYFSSAPTPSTPTPPSPTPPSPTPPTPSGKYPAYPVPKNPDDGYFNYNYKDMKYGPNAWHTIPATKTHAYKYWKDLEKYMPADFNKNTCNSKASFNENRASPIDVRTTDDRCMEFHQIRPNRKTEHMPLLGPVGKSADLDITSHSLRVYYPRVSKYDLTVPSADLPMGWGKFLHVAYCEFKVPASHSIRGKKFAAEMNCYIIQKAGRGLGVFTILFEIRAFNSNLEHAIAAFDAVHKEHKSKCGGGGGGGDFQQSKYWSKGWNPFEFMYQTKSWWFYGYKGTLMEPPCYQMVEYRIIDTPVSMSKAQLEDMKRILFTHQDPKTCRYTSVHNDDESVVRDVQPSKRARVHRCTCRDFLSDQQRDRSRMKSCPKGSEKKWMPNSSDLKPAPGECWDKHNC